MKRNLFFAAALFLFLGSCGGGNYSEITYTNQSGSVIEFSTAEDKTPRYTLSKGEEFSLPSDVRGRAEIVYIDKPLVTWEYRNRDDVYHIDFVDRVPIDLEIRNYSGWQGTVTEKYKLITDKDKKKDNIAISLRKQEALLYTETPIWIFTGSRTPAFKTRLPDEDKRYILAIDPPAEKWWEEEFKE